MPVLVKGKDVRVTITPEDLEKPAKEFLEQAFAQLAQAGKQKKMFFNESAAADGRLEEVAVKPMTIDYPIMDKGQEILHSMLADATRATSLAVNKGDSLRQFIAKDISEKSGPLSPFQQKIHSALKSVSDPRYVSVNHPEHEAMDLLKDGIADLSAEYAKVAQEIVVGERKGSSKSHVARNLTKDHHSIGRHR